MASFRVRALLPILLVAGAAGQAMAVQPGDVPPDAAGAPPARFTPHPYSSALWAMANYQSCGVHARRAEVAALNAALRASVAAARRKGLGPLLDRLERGYQAQMAIIDLTACGGGPAASRAAARNAVAAFRQWVAAQPAR